MGRWISDHKAPLAVAVVLFAFMAMFMAEFFMLDAPDDVVREAGQTGLFGLSEALPESCLWIWRAGGFVTWPVFMVMMLLPHAKAAKAKGPAHSATPSSVLALTALIAAFYGSCGLWLVNTVCSSIIAVLSSAEQMLVLTPLFAAIFVVLPFAYVWGFVAIYGFARTALSDIDARTWLWPSIGGSVCGVFVVGFLIYAAIIVVLAPIALAFSLVSSQAVVTHLSFDLLAMAVSTGNFASQWLGFKKVDEKLDPFRYAKRKPSAPAYPAYPTASFPHAGVPAMPYAPTSYAPGDFAAPAPAPEAFAPQVPASHPVAPASQPATAQPATAQPAAPAAPTAPTASAPKGDWRQNVPSVYAQPDGALPAYLLDMLVEDESANEVQ